MLPNHTEFLDAIHEMKLVRIEFYSKPDAAKIDRECAPLDYGPVAGAEDAGNRYWVWDFANSTGANPIGLVSEQIVSLQVLGKGFVPHELGLAARSWSVPRKWKIGPEASVQPGGGERAKVQQPRDQGLISEKP